MESEGEEMRKVHSVGVVFLWALSLTACGQPDVEVEKPEDFWTAERIKVSTDEIRQSFRSKKFERVVHIHFNGQDFGAFRDFETSVDFHTQGKKLPFAKEKISEKAAALKIITDFDDVSVLFSLIYRHASAKRAQLAFTELFECKDGKSELLARTFVLGSGASHGADELDFFGQHLKEECGKGLDFAILSDAIGQPGPFPLFKFHGLSEGGSCLQFYQRAFPQLIQGAPVEGCTNVKVQKAYHFGEGGMTRYPEAWAQLLLRSLRLHQTDIDLALFFERIPFLRERLL